MTQSDFGNLSSPLSGSDFINNKLEPWRDSLHSTHSGTSRPSYVVSGLVWMDTTTTPWLVKLYDGTNDITLYSINATTHAVIFSGSNIDTASILQIAKIGAGVAPATGNYISIGGSATGATVIAGYSNAQTVQSGVTSGYNANSTSISTAAAAFTLNALKHYVCDQGTIGAGSTVTNQFGYVAGATLIGATNNYGFYGDIAAGTNRYNLYMNGTADNLLNGSLGIGGTPAGTATNLSVTKNITGGTSSFGISQVGVVQSAATNFVSSFYSKLNTQATAFTCTQYNHYYAAQGTLGAGSTVTNQYGFIVDSSFTSATNNYGFASQIVSGTGRYNIYMDGTAPNYLAGSLGIGSAPTNTTQATTNLALQRTITSSGGAGFGIYNATVAGNPTGTLYNFYSLPITSAASYTVTGAHGYYAEDASIGSGSTITNQYGFTGNLAAGTGKYNIYMQGTAQNYIAGRVGIGAQPDSATKLYVSNAAASEYAIQATSITAATATIRVNNVDTSGTRFYMDFRVGAGFTQTGSISTNGTTTSYTTSSDRRLKENIVNLGEVGTIIDAIQPRSFNWISNSQDDVGFIAQELYEIVPNAVIVGNEDDISSDSESFKSWSVDLAKLIPYILAEVKSLRLRVAELEV